VPSALDYVLENTTFSGKAGLGGTDFRAFRLRWDKVEC